LKRFAYLFVALLIVVTLATSSTTEASWFLQRYRETIGDPIAPEPDDPSPIDPPATEQPPEDEDNSDQPVHYGGWAPEPEPAPEPAPVPTPKPEPPSDDPRGELDPADSATAKERQVLDMINDDRAEEGLDPLRLDLTLTKLARMKAADLVENNVFSHTSPTYGNPIQMLKSYGITYKSMGENLGTAGNIWVVHYRLLASPGHRANIMDPDFTHVGIGIVPNGSGVLVCELFVEW